MHEIEARYGRMVASIPVGIFRLDGQGDCTYVNPEMQLMTGLTQESAQGDGFLDAVHPKQREEMRAAWHQAAQRGEAFEAEIRVGPPGRYRWASARTIGEYDDAGRLVGYVGTLTDIHARVTAETAMRANAEFHRHVLANLPGATVVIFDADLRCQLFEGPYVQHTKLPAGWFVGKPLAEILPPESAAVLEPALREALAGREAALDYLSPLSDRTLAIRTAPYLDEAREIVGAVLVGHDVTAEREAQEARVEAERRFEVAFDRAPIGMCLVSFEGHLLRVNEAMAGLTGFSPEELQEMSVLDITPPEDRAESAAGLQRVRAGAETHAAVKRYVHADGRIVWVEVKANVIADADGRPLYLLAQIRDITERREQEEARDELLRQRAEQVARLRELDRAKDEFVSFVSHELRTPLTSVQGYLDVLLEEPEELNDMQQRFLDTIHRNTLRLNRLVTDLLDLARVDAGKLQLDRGAVDLSELVRHAVVAAEPGALSKGLGLISNITPGILVEGDAVRLAQVFDNLVSNAVKYTLDGGIAVTLARSEDAAALTVADTGIGIPADERERLFERFYRASTATGRNIAGTGLGLSISRTIVDAHGGEITVADRAPQGTVFTVSLPL